MTTTPAHPSDPLPAETLRALREKAQKATPGPWWTDDGETSFGLFLGNGGDVWGRDHAAWMLCVDGEDGYANGECDAAFIAACDPQTVLRLLDELERLRAENEKHEEYINELLSRQAYPGP